MVLKILNWNVRGIKSKINELGEKIKNYDIISLTETKTNYKDKVKFSVYRHDGLQTRTNGIGGAMLLVKSTISQTRIQNLKMPSGNIDCTGAIIRGKKYKFMILTVYRKPGMNETKGTWKKLLSNYKGYKIIMMGDFNAHNIVWNCNKTDKNGSMLFEECDDESLYIINRSDTISRIGEGGCQDSNLDLMFCTNTIVHRITYKQKKDTWGSDHYPIS